MFETIFHSLVLNASTPRRNIAPSSPPCTTLSHIYISWLIQWVLPGCQMSAGDQITFINTRQYADDAPPCRVRLSPVPRSKWRWRRRCSNPQGASWLGGGERGGSLYLCRCWKSVVFLHIDSESLRKTDGAVPGGVALSVTLTAKRAQTMELICSLFFFFLPDFADIP